MHEKNETCRQPRIYDRQKINEWVSKFYFYGTNHSGVIEHWNRQWLHQIYTDKLPENEFYKWLKWSEITKSFCSYFIFVVILYSYYYIFKGRHLLQQIKKVFVLEICGKQYCLYLIFQTALLAEGKPYRIKGCVKKNRFILVLLIKRLNIRHRMTGQSNSIQASLWSGSVI